MEKKNLALVDYFENGAVFFCAAVMLTVTAPLWLPIAMLGWLVYRLFGFDVSQHEGYF